MSTSSISSSSSTSRSNPLEARPKGTKILSCKLPNAESPSEVLRYIQISQIDIKQHPFERTEDPIDRALRLDREKREAEKRAQTSFRNAYSVHDAVCEALGQECPHSQYYLTEQAAKLEEKAEAKKPAVKTGSKDGKTVAKKHLSKLQRIEGIRERKETPKRSPLAQVQTE